MLKAKISFEIGIDHNNSGKSLEEAVKQIVSSDEDKDIILKKLKNDHKF